MFKDNSALRVPVKQIDAFSVEPASYGGGYILRLVIDDRSETVVFTDRSHLTQYLQLLLSGQALALGVDSAAPEAPKSEETSSAASEVPAPKRKGGRPRLTDEEKAANRARRLEAKNEAAPAAETAQAA